MVLKSTNKEYEAVDQWILQYSRQQISLLCSWFTWRDSFHKVEAIQRDDQF